MKKILLLLVSLFLMISVYGCSENEESNIIEENKETEIEKTESEKEETHTKSSFPTIDEQVLFEYDDIKLTAISIEEDWLGPQLKILIENNSDKNITVELDAIAVNDCMVSAWLYEDVGPGKKSNATFDIWSSKLSDAGISNIGKIDMYFRIIDSDNFNEIYESSEVEIRTSLYDVMDGEIDDIGEEMVNQNGIKIIGKGVSNDLIWGDGVVVYIENNTDRNIVVTTDDLSVNGFMITSFLYQSVRPGKKAIESIILSSSDLDDNGIESIEELSLSFEVYDEDTYHTIIKTDEMSFNIE